MKDITININNISLEGILSIPEKAQGIVLFAHGSGSSRHSPRNTYVAESLNNVGLATLLFDLLTAEEEAVDIHTREFRFDINLLTERLKVTTDWVIQNPETQDLHIGYFGSSTGAASALVAASQRQDIIKAIVSRGGRPDLAGVALAEVKAPTLLIVGGNDFAVIDMNQEAMAQMHSKTKLEIISGATHLFEEPGTLDEVINHAAAWFTKYLTS